MTRPGVNSQVSGRKQMVQVLEKAMRGFSRALGIETPADLDIRYQNSVVETQPSLLDNAPAPQDQANQAPA
jgi:hypothetical protein